MNKIVVPHDYHIHTRFSCDGKQSMEDVCERALDLGLPEICFTEHVDFTPGDPCSFHFKADEYFRALARVREQYGDRLLIRAGAEMGESHRFPYETEILMDEYPFDFIIGSLHWVGEEFVFSRDYFERNGKHAAYQKYFEELLVMVRVGGFDVVGHFDVVKRYGYDVVGPYDPHEHEEIIREVLTACVDEGIGLEVNTSTLRRPVGEPSPSLTILKWYRELGGEIVTLGSDAHETAHVGYALADMVELLQAAGFEYVARFVDRQAEFVKITSNE